MGQAPAGEDLGFGPWVGIAQAQAHEEAIELRLGQREGAFILDGILRGQHGERTRHSVTDAAHGDLAFFHAFQQRGLRLGRGPVDLIGEHNLGHNGSRPVLKGAGVLVVDLHAGHIAGQEVGRKLNALERGADRAGQGFGQHRLAHAGYVFDQHVAGRQHRGEHQVDGAVFTHQGTAHVGRKTLPQLAHAQDVALRHLRPLAYQLRQL